MSVAAWGGKTAAQRVSPHHLAWGVLLACFALFCVLLVTFLLAANHFLFLSALSMDAILNVSRGTVGVSDLANPVEQVGIHGSVLADGVIVRTDPQSQGAIHFMDMEGQEERLVVALTLQRDSRVTLLSAERPRFAWSRRSYEIALKDVIGEINLYIAEHAGPEIRVHGRTPGGAGLEMTSPGSYTIEGASEELRLFNHNGAVRLEAPDGRQLRDVPAGGQGAVLYEEGRVELRPGFRNLLLDENFGRLRTGASGAEGPGWTCDGDPDDNPPGLYDFLTTGGSQPLRFLRGGGAITHGRNFCTQHFGQDGLDLKRQDLEYLALRVSFFVEHASLGTCGTQGSECPLMVRMDYLDQDYFTQGEDARTWHHGFYIRPRDGWPLRCDTCLQDHELINGQAWYVYESPNLLTLFSPRPPPEIIVSFWVYASGHEYDVRVRDVALLAIPRAPEDA